MSPRTTGCDGEVSGWLLFLNSLEPYSALSFTVLGRDAWGSFRLHTGSLKINKRKAICVALGPYVLLEYPGAGGFERHRVAERSTDGSARSGGCKHMLPPDSLAVGRSTLISTVDCAHSECVTYPKLTGGPARREHITRFGLPVVRVGGERLA